MVRKPFAINMAIVISLLAELFLIVNLFTHDKSTARFAWAVGGFCLIPFSATLYVKCAKIQQVSKVIIITGIWIAWIILAAIGAFTTYYYQQNGGSYGDRYCSCLIDNNRFLID